MDPSQLSQLLSHLRSADNEARKAAEEQLDSLSQSQPVWLMHALAEVCATTEDTGNVTLVLILLRKLFNTSTDPALTGGAEPVPVFGTADAATQAAVKGRLLQVLGTAAYGPQRGSAGACVSALAVAINKGGQQWDELWTSIFQILGAAESDNELKAICCDIIATVAGSMTDFLLQQRAPLTQGLGLCLGSSGSNTKVVKESAFKAIVALVPLGFQSDFGPLVPAMLGSIQECLNAGHWDTAETLLMCIVQGLADSPQLFEQQGMALLTGLMQVATSAETPAKVRHSAVEGLLTFCEELPKAARKVPRFVTSFFELLFQYSLSPEFPESWDTSNSVLEDEDELDEVSDYLIACSGLDRMAQAIGGRKLKDTAQRLFMENIPSPDWKHRHAAVSLICHVTEGMQAAFAKQIGALVAAIVPCIADESKYVRSMALETFAQLCQDFAPHPQVEFHGQFLPPVIGALRDPIPHVAASAARCLDSAFDSVITDEMDEDDDDIEEYARMFAPYAGQVCNDCVTLIQSTNVESAREAALGALSSLISTVKDQMTPFTAALVPVFQAVLAQPDSPEIMDSKCKAIECVTLLATGVGKEAMGGYAQSICEFLQAICQQGIKNDDPRFRFVLRGWTCMIECLKQDSMPYVDGIMPMLLGLMDLDCDIVLVEANVGDEDEDEADAAAGIECVRIVIPGVGERVAKVHTSLIEDKELACNIVSSIMMELGTNLSNYFPQIARSAIKLLDFKANDSIRESGALLLTSVMEAYVEMGSPDSQALAAEALPPLLNALAEEPEADITGTLMECVSNCVAAFPAIVTAQNVRIISEKLQVTLDQQVKLRRAVMGKKAGEQDEDELDDLEGQDAGLCENIRCTTDLIGTLLERAGPIFGPIFSERFFPTVAAWLQPSEDDFFVSRGLVIICDFVEHAAAQVALVLPTLMSSSLAFATSRTDEGVLQSDFYLINNLLQYLSNPANNASGVNAAAFAAQCQQALAAYLAAPMAATEDYRSTTDNAISTYVTLLQCFGEALGPQTVSQMLQALASALPCADDDIEARRVHDRVLSWVTGSHPMLAANPGADQALVARIKAAKPDFLSDAAKEQLARM